MKQKIQLQIPKPCHENWNNMTATEQGRFCMSCRKEVIDFSVMSDKEILNYISTASGNMCGRVQDDQLNRFIQTPNERKQFSFKYFWSLLITSFLISYKSNAQIKAPKDKIVCGPGNNRAGDATPRITMGTVSSIVPDKINIEIKGKVLDENGNPLPYASVMLKDAKMGTGVAADSAGNFTLHTTNDLKNIELVVSFIGYEVKTVEINPNQIKALAIEGKMVKMQVADISLKAHMLSGVIVVASQCLTGRMGGMVAGIRITSYEKAKIKLNELIGKNDVKVYPNPVQPNSSFNITFNIKEKGAYIISFIDASGRIMTSRELSITSTNQSETFNSNQLTASGVYFVRVMGKQNKKVYDTKLLVQ